jgi:hypothetical protein
MFDELKKYKTNGHFFLKPEGNLESVCNAPKNTNGIYIIYELKRGHINLVFIGSSGMLQNNGTLKKYSSLFESINNEAQQMSWIKRMKQEKTDALDIYWYETFNQKIKDVPSFIKALLLKIHIDIYGQLPSWNPEF